MLIDLETVLDLANSGFLSEESLEKALGRKNFAKLMKKQITDKNGHIRNVYVKVGEDFVQHQRNKKEEVAQERKFSKSQMVAFVDNGKTKTGTIKNIENGIATIVNGGIAYKVNQKSILPTIPHNLFDANNYKVNATEKDITENSVYTSLSNDPKIGKAIVDQAITQTKNRMNELKATMDAGNETIRKYRISGDGVNAVYTPERTELHKKILKEIFKRSKVKNAKPLPGEKPMFVMFGGRGGSGKSWFTNVKLANQQQRKVMFDPEKFITLDADAIKEYLPEFKGWNAGEVHEESSDIMKMATKIAKDKHLNIIIDGTMAYNPEKPDKVRKQMLDFKNDGYRIEAHYMFLPLQESCKRAVMRFAHKNKQTKQYDFKGRLVPMNILLGMKDNEKSFDSIKDIVDDWSFRDNNVNPGENPILISKKG